MSKNITVKIEAEGFTGLTPQNIEKALSYYFGTTFGVSFSVSEADLARAEALVNEWRYLAENKPMSPIRASVYKTCADELAAALEDRK